MKYHMRYGTGTGNLLQDGSAIHGVLWAMNPSLTAVGLSTLAFKAYLRPDSARDYITVGVRATVPTRNIEVLEKLGIRDKPAQQKVQSSMAKIAATHLNRIVPQYRRLCARQNKCINANKTGVG